MTTPEDASLMEILDRVLDHGIVLEPSSRLRLMGLDLQGTSEQFKIDWGKTRF